MPHADREHESPLRELEPRAGLQDRVVAALDAEGLLTHPSTRTSQLARAAAALLLVAVAFLAGRAGGTRAPSPTHALFVRSSEWSVDPERSPADAERVAREYGRWAGELAAVGRLAGAAELAPGGWIIDPSGVEPLPPAELGRATSGYFLLSVESDERALEIARDCPHLGYGGTVELRPLELGR